MKIALLQLTSSDDPANNLKIASGLMEDAAALGAQYVFTPEVTNCVSLDRHHQQSVLQTQQDDATLKGLQAAAKSLNVWLSIGSLALKGGEGGRFVNRSFLINPEGETIAQYDKAHMFDVDVSEAEKYRESAGYAPGSEMVLSKTPDATFGLSICYDIRFPYLYRALAQAGADVLLVPSAFSQVTGAAHWEPLLRARAIETGSFVVAAAQSGTHKARSGEARQTFGHSMVISPWGEVLIDAGTETGVFVVEIDLRKVAESRQRIPSLLHDRTIN